MNSSRIYPSKHILLVGMMGAGKSHIGVRLAERLNTDFVDTDDEIEDQENCTAAQIFADHGEAYFRDCEHRVLRAVLARQPCVIATGGGVYVFDRNRKLIDQRGVSVYLSVSPEIIWQRIGKDKQRPLAMTWRDFEDMLKFMKQRQPHYTKAHAIVEIGENQSPDEIVDAVWRAVADKV